MFLECDEDGLWADDCKDPNVVTVFGNFYRKKKCKYYKQITYEKMLKEVKRRLSAITSYSFYYRDPRKIGPLGPPSKLTKGKITWIKFDIRRYLDYRDYLFNELKSKKEVDDEDNTI